MDLSHYTTDYNDKVEQEYKEHWCCIQTFADHVNVYCDKNDVAMDLLKWVALFSENVWHFFNIKVMWIKPVMTVNIFIDCWDEWRWCCHFWDIMSYRYILSGETEIIRWK